MKKLRAAILICDLMMGLLLFCGCLYRSCNVEKAFFGEMENIKLEEDVMRQAEDAQSVQVNNVQDGQVKQTGGVQGGQEKTGEDMSGEPAEELKKVALTFDDGPHPFYTEQLLDGLKERGVVVTFFVTGEHATLHPEVIKRMQKEGHLIGNHTYSHIQLRSDNRETFKEELVRTNEALKEITGEDIIYVRPPYGSWDKSLEKELNMIPVLWTVDPLDWCSDDAACVVRSVTEKVEENDIVLLHDYYDSTVTAALKIVDELLEEGYVFVTVEEILFG